MVQPVVPVSVSHTSPNNVLSLQLVIAALKCHKYDKSIQVTGSAALFYLTNTEYRSDQSVRLRREVIQVVLNGMEQYQEVTVSQLCVFNWIQLVIVIRKIEMFFYTHAVV